MTVPDGLGDPGGPALHRLRELAGRGELAGITGAERRPLYRAAYTLTYPIVFDVVTRRLEHRRGHQQCARGVRHLDGPCLDGFYDDVEAVVDLLLATAKPITDLERWLARRAQNAAVDGYRRRRGEHGALQRPRMTRTLAAALPDRPWLRELALKILVWVGLPHGAGAVLWPLETWARDRAAFTGDPRGSTPARVQADIDEVLAAMRVRRTWYEEHVERPLGRKSAPVGGSPGDRAGEPRPLVAADPGERLEARISETAAAVLRALEKAPAADGDTTRTVEKVLRAFFLEGTGADEIDQPPRAGSVPYDRLSELFGDPAARDALIGRILRIVREPAD